MPDKKIYFRTAAISLMLTAIVWVLLCASGKNTLALNLGFLLGIAVCLLALRLFFAAWRAAPDKSRVALYYLLRAAVVFGSIAAALFVPGINALGVVVPQLFPVPVLAVLLLVPERGPHK